MEFQEPRKMVAHSLSRQAVAVPAAGWSTNSPGGSLVAGAFWCAGRGRR